ncbi:hypothetical protein QMZ92_24930 [Streptomyces sp. HNM0645]|uniref:hypothetical protein n=1 Tax=Streptomyces sp. HNM0645 TaxID=2782343 RepID=UPI0024B77EE4|nr:hypothetical protein [Streptomyces sp. HNM0645]MDI9887524.1 hypothetical protein [Streptomyces sp. HNM0645]
MSKDGRSGAAQPSTHLLVVESHGGADESVKGCASAFRDLLIGHGSQYSSTLLARETRDEDPPDRATNR